MSEYIKKTYNKMVGEELKGNYEYDRWFKTPGQRAGFKMTKKIIELRVLPNISSKEKNVLELGPGAGTWTKLLLGVLPQANYDLVDISREMLKVARQELGKISINIKYIETDFLDFEANKKYDLFFSSRALEYIIDKELVVKKIYDLLNKGSLGFIITKTPHYLRQRILGRKVPIMHRKQIKPRNLKILLQNQGFENIEIYPVVMNFYFSWLKSLWGNWFIFNIFYKFPLNIISSHFSESYIIKFRKP